MKKELTEKDLLEAIKDLDKELKASGFFLYFTPAPQDISIVMILPQDNSNLNLEAIKGIINKYKYITILPDLPGSMSELTIQINYNVFRRKNIIPDILNDEDEV